MQRLPMRKIREALAHAAGLTQREIAASLGAGRTVGEYLDRAPCAIDSPINELFRLYVEQILMPTRRPTDICRARSI